MGSTQAPTFQVAKESGYGLNNVEGGAGLFSQIQNHMNEGISPQAREAFFTNLAGKNTGMLTTGTNKINESFSQGGRMGSSAKLSAISSLFDSIDSNSNKAGNDFLLEDDQRRASNFSGGMGQLFGLLDLARTIGANKNQFSLSSTGMQNENAMNRYKIDKENEFNWGSAIGSLIGAGGQVAGAYLGKP